MYALAWMTGTLLSFSLMAVCARELSGAIATPQILFFRSLAGLLLILMVANATGKYSSLGSKNLALHSFRNIFHFAGQYGWFLGIALLPLAEVFALEFTVPLWTLIIAAMTLGEQVTWRKVSAVLLGISGVLIILQPGFAIIDSASLIVLASAVCYAVSHSTTKWLSASESALSILYYMCLIQLPIGLLLSVFDWVWPVGIQWLWLALIGFLALSAHYCMTKAMRHAEASTVVTLDFLRLPLISVVGVLLYAEEFELAVLIGGLLMLAGNLLNLRQPASGKGSPSTNADPGKNETS